jgi:outer membrane biosynthesis protein TonB
MFPSMRRLALLLLVFAACAQETRVNTDTMDTREPIAVRYVGTPELPVRVQPSDTAAVIATYQNGEAISVLSQKGDWAEVRTGDRAGWAHAADLTDAAGKKAQEDNPQPKFRVMPLPVSAPSARGEIYIEASINSDGEVTDVRIITNTTGSTALAQQNADALRSAKLYPIMQKGERRPFKYYHRVTY